VKNIKLLDCTLRDGGRLFDCKFSDYEISEICRRLSRSNIDIVEVGFIRDPKSIQYLKDSTFFTDVEQIAKFLPPSTDTQFVAFVDYGMFDPDTLPVCNQTSITGLRVGFTRKNYLNDRDGVLKTLIKVKNKGYTLYVQGVNSLGYSDQEFSQVLELINAVKPYSFGVVDTYGAMYPADAIRLFNTVNKTLDEDIAIDFHAHNNKQLAFANAINVIMICPPSRSLIIDGTLEGMGKCAGNLNLELIANYLSDECGYNYDFDEILDTIDEFIRPIKNKYSWGYSIPALMGGLYKSHPNNIIYLYNKFRLSSKDFKNILSMIDSELRQRYDYDNIERLYQEYSNIKIDDSDAVHTLFEKYTGKRVLVKSPGHTLVDYDSKISEFIKENNPEIITVSFAEYGSICFTANKRRYEKLIDKTHYGFILTSNVKSISAPGEYIVNYDSLVDRRYKYYDNSVMMLLNLLKKIHVSEIIIAGFDGYTDESNNYLDETFRYDRDADELAIDNYEISKMIKNFIKTAEPDIKVTFLTPSKYLI